MNEAFAPALRIADLRDGIDVFAIGDVHGRADLLEPLLEVIRQKAAGREYQVVFLGDLVDRGPDSRRVMELALETVEDVPGSVVIMGNHEEFMIDAIGFDDPEVYFDDWMAFGGAEAVESFGIQAGQRHGSAIAALRQEPLLRRIIPMLYDAAQDSERIYAHAGLRPHVALDRQTAKDLRWIRMEFLADRSSHGRTVVHGHTPTGSDLPEVYVNRVAVDTGAYETGRLSAAWFAPGRDVRFLLAEERKGAVSVRENDGVKAR